MTVLAGVVGCKDDVSVAEHPTADRASLCAASGLQASPATASVSRGTVVQFAAGGACAPSEQAEYQYWVSPPNGPWAIIRPYDSDPNFSWDTSELVEGKYDFQVWVRAAGSSAVYETYAARSVRVQSTSACLGAAALVSSAAGSVVPGTAVTLTASSSGCAQPEYKFWMLAPNAGWSVVRDFAADPSYSFDTSAMQLGSYDFQVWSRAAGTEAAYDAYAGARVTLASEAATPCSGSAAMSASPARVAHVGDTIQLTGSASACATPEYEFWMLPPDGGWRIVRPYAADPSYAWQTTGAASGAYHFQVWMRAAGSQASYDAYGGLRFQLEPAPEVCSAAQLQFSSLGTLVAGAVQGSSLTVYAGASGCSDAQYQFWVQDPSGVWSLFRDWDSSSSFEWQTSGISVGTYNWQVWTRQRGSSAEYEAYTGGSVEVWPTSYGSNGLVDDRTITIQSDEDATNLRARMVQAIWGRAGFPSLDQLPIVRRNVASPMTGLSNLARVDELDISMPARSNEGADIQVEARAYHFIPSSSVRARAVVLLQGHDCALDDSHSDDDEGAGMWRTVSSLLTNGYSPIVVQMAQLTTSQCGCPSDWQDCAHPHDWLFDHVSFDPETGGAMRFFVEPTARVLNYLQTQAEVDEFPQYSDFSAVGLSGGGWTATVYAALDPRVSLSVPVAGTLPLYLRGPGEAGDREQHDPTFYSVAGYLDIYLLAAYGMGRKQVQVLNRRDSCCFGELQRAPEGEGAYDRQLRAYEGRVREALSTLGTGHFRLHIDEAAAEHQISWSTVVDTLIAELSQTRRSVGAASKLHAFVRGMNGTLAQHTPEGWRDAGIAVVGVPSVIGRAEGSFDIFYRAPESNQLSYSFGTSLEWTSQDLPSSVRINSDPVAASWGDGHWDVVAVGSDYELYHWWSHGNGIQFQPVARGLRVRGLPALVARAPGQLDLFVRNSDRALIHLASDGEGPWVLEELGGRFLGVPAAVAEPSDGMGVYISDVNGGLVRGAPAVSGWGWTAMRAPLGDVLSGSPSAAVKEDGTVQVHARTTGGSLGTFSIANGWAYENQGGNIVGSPTAFPGGAFARGQRGELLRLEGQSWVQLGGNFD
ncbi:MAG: hypothetical protein ACOY0T_23185 [Myxococcota bacterium]